MHAEFLESPVIFSRRSSVEGTSKCRKRKRPRVPASKHARALRGRALRSHACMRACVLTCMRAFVRACVRTVNDRRARTPQGHALTHVRAPLRARSRARARVSTLSRAITAPSTFDFLRLLLFLPLPLLFFFLLFLFSFLFSRLLPPPPPHFSFFCRRFLLRFFYYITMNYARVAITLAYTPLPPAEGLTCDRAQHRKPGHN